MDEAGNTIERFADEEEISIEYDDVSSIAYRFSILEPSGQTNDLQLHCLDDSLPINMMPFFQLTYNNQTEINHETGEYRATFFQQLKYTPDCPDRKTVTSALRQTGTAVSTRNT